MEKIFEMLARNLEKIQEAFFRIFEKTIENDVKKIEEMKRISRLLEQIRKGIWTIAGLVFFLVILAIAKT